MKIAAALTAARAVAQGRGIAVVQPHRYTRLRNLFEEFCTCFNDADIVIVSHVHPAGETPIEGIDRDALIRGLHTHGHRQVLALDDPSDLPGLIHNVAEAGDLVICLGAGSISGWAHELPNGLQALAVGQAGAQT